MSCTDKEDTVLDPFVGSGTTSAVAKELGRNSIGIEKDKKYLKIIRKRLNTSQKTLDIINQPEIMFEKFKSKT